MSPQALALWLRWLPGSRLPGLCSCSGQHLRQRGLRLGALPSLLHPYVFGAPRRRDPQAVRVIRREMCSVLPNSRAGVCGSTQVGCGHQEGGRPHVLDKLSVSLL